MGVTLGKKQLNKGRISLYLNYSHNGKRRKEYLGIILEAPVTPEARAENKNKILIAKQIRAKKELEFLSVEYALNKTAETFEDILPEAPSNGPDFFRIMNEYLSTYYKKDKKMVKSTILHLRTFNKKKILPINKITREFCVDFLDYLRSKLRGNTPIGYFKKFRMCINKCVEKKLISHNPTNGIRLSQFDEVTKEILTLKEIQKLAVTSCPNNEVKRAFLFSCYCGLLTAPLRARFGINLHLEYYDDDVLTAIIRRSAKILNVPCDVQAAGEIASRSRGTPRIANALLRRVRDFAQVKGSGRIDVEIARFALEALNIDRYGLDEIDNKILCTIIDKFKGGPVGLTTIATALGEDPGTIEEVYEPFLIKEGFLKRTPRGREVTELAYIHLGRSIYNSQKTLFDD